MKTIFATRRAAVAALCLFSLGAAGAEDAMPETEPETPVLPQQATLLVFNISGPTLFSSNQDITDNGIDLVSLPRKTFKRMHIAPGPHAFRFKPFPQGKRVAELDAQAGQTYYLVVGYNPAKSWAFPIAGDPMVIKLVNEDEASPLMKDMAEQ